MAKPLRSNRSIQHGSSDARYNALRNDEVGQQLLRELRDASLRGVRLRQLAYELQAAGEDALIDRRPLAPGRS